MTHWPQPRWAATLVLALASPALAQPAVPPEAGSASDLPLHFAFHGEYRVRFFALQNILEDGRGTGLYSDVDSAHFFVQRLRLEPTVGVGPDPDKPIGSLHVQIDALDNVVLGDNSGLATVPLFAGDPTTVDRTSEEVPSLRLERVWLEVTLPVGQLRVGRMPSQWGMGLLTSDGNGFDDDFGDNVRGSTFDRILFATRPVAIARALTGRPPGDFPLILAVAYDMLVEFATDEDGPARSPYGDWLADGADDVQQWTFVLFYNDTAPNPLQPTDEIKGGLYFVNRTQPATRSNVFIADAYFKLRWGPWFAEGEGLHIWGSSRAIPFPPPDPGELAARKDANIWGGVTRLGVETPLVSGRFEVGYASGDAVREDQDFTGRPLHPDFNVGLLLYEEVLAEKSAQTWGTSARGFWSQGGVYDSYYLALTGKLRPRAGLELIALGLIAFPDEIDTVIEANAPLGFEVDLAAKLEFLRYFRASLEAGVLFPMDGLGTVAIGTPWTVQSRLAMVF